MKINLKFLSPRLLNVLITLAVFSLPLIRERSRLPDGTITEVVFYRPIYLLASYLQMNDFYPFFLMVGFFLVIYVAVSVIVAVVLWIWGSFNKNHKMLPVISKPSAWIPFAMSAVALVMVVGYVMLFGVQQSSGDEGIMARLFQLLLVGQIPVIGYFVVKWYPRNSKQVLKTVVLQILAALVPFLTVFFLEM